MTRTERHTHSGFTLIETLIASVIMLVVLGSALGANRLIQNQASTVEDQFEMSALAQEPIDDLGLMGDTLSHGAIDGLLFPSGDSLQNDSQAVGLFTASPCPIGTDPSCASNGGGRVLLGWCSKGSSRMSDEAVISDKGDGLQLSLTDLFHDTTDFELVAVRRTLPGPYEDKRQSVDQASPVSAATVSTVAWAGSASDQAKWSFYKRKVSIKRLGSAQIGTKTYSDPGGSNLLNTTYVITVEVRNLRSLQSATTRTATVLSTN